MQMNVAEVTVQPITDRFKRGVRVKTRVYVWPKGETIMDNLLNRRSRPIKEFRSVANRALVSIGVDTTKIDMRWSQKAGCACGCSPGFIVEGYDPNIDGRNVHVDVEMS